MGADRNSWPGRGKGTLRRNGTALSRSSVPSGPLARAAGRQVELLAFTVAAARDVVLVDRAAVMQGHRRVRRRQRRVEEHDQVEAAVELGPLQEDPVDDQD